jgi:hypothetical protein
MPAAPEMVTVRPIRFDEIADGLAVYHRNDHGGVTYLTPGTLTKVTRRPVSKWARPADQAEVGEVIEAKVRTPYAQEFTFGLFSSEDALLVKHPEDYPQERARALEKQADPGVYLLDPDGDRVFPLTPVWGSEANLRVLVPDVDPEELRAAIEETLRTRYPGVRIPRNQTRPVADLRVNLYRANYGTPRVVDGQVREPTLVPVALHILRPEAVAMYAGDGSDVIEDVHPDATAPVVGF